SSDRQAADRARGDRGGGRTGRARAFGCTGGEQWRRESVGIEPPHGGHAAKFASFSGRFAKTPLQQRVADRWRARKEQANEQRRKWARRSAPRERRVLEAGALRAPRRRSGRARRSDVPAGVIRASR